MSNTAESALAAAGIGGWELELATGRLEWTPLTFRIFEVDPPRPPPARDIINFYPPDVRPLVEATLTKTIISGVPWDLELPFVTAKRRHIWVRVCGRAIQEAGKTTRLSGSIEDITARRTLAEREARLSVVVRHMTNAVVITDHDGRTEWVNDGFTRLTGWTMEDMRGQFPGALLYCPETDPATIRHIADSVREGRVYEVEILTQGKDGTKRLISAIGSPVRDDKGALIGFISVESDVTERRAAEERARHEALERASAEALLRDVLSALPSGVTVYDANEAFILSNRAFAELFPITAEMAVPGRSFADVIRLAAERGQYPDAGTTPESQAKWVADQVAAFREATTPRTLRLPDGRYAQARERRSESGNVVCVRTDTTNLVRAEENMRLLAERDPLTLLANRSSFLAVLDRALAGHEPHGGSGALLLLDVDYFKQINDSLGHDVGDKLLWEIAERMRTHLRGSDVAARLGGDEYGVVMPGLTDPKTLAARMDTIHAALSAPLELAGRRLPIGLSVGVTRFPSDGTDAAKLLKNADLALYDAKRNGRGRWSAFRPEQSAALQQHIELADALRDALAECRVTVAFQPKCVLRAGGGHAGFEALARWHDGTRWVPPSEFIPVAEDMSLIGRLSVVVMEAAISRSREIRDNGLDPGRIAVNVTAQQLLDDNFKTGTLEALRRYGLRPSDLELEITETVLLGRASERIDAILREFSDLGVTLALDDFGTGYASLAHLSRLPIDRLKIDRSFVDGIGKSGSGGVIARAVIGLAHSLQMEVIAEGVETPEQLAFLQAAGCDAAQGYLFARPFLTTPEAIEYLRGATKHVDIPAADAIRR